MERKLFDVNPTETYTEKHTKNRNAPLSLSSAEWDELAALSKLELSREDRSALSADLGLLREFAAQLADCSVSRQAREETEAQPLREDLAEACLSRDELLAAAPRSDGDYIAVPAVLPLGEKEGA